MNKREESLRKFGDTIKWPNICLLEREEKDAAEALLVEQVGTPPMLYFGQVSQISPLKEMEFLSGKI